MLNSTTHIHLYLCNIETFIYNLYASLKKEGTTPLEKNKINLELIGAIHVLITALLNFFNTVPRPACPVTECIWCKRDIEKFINNLLKMIKLKHQTKPPTGGTWESPLPVEVGPINEKNLKLLLEYLGKEGGEIDTKINERNLMIIFAADDAKKARADKEAEAAKVAEITRRKEAAQAARGTKELKSLLGIGGGGGGGGSKVFVF